LDQLLAPHRLVVRAGPAGILQVVRADPVKRSPPPAPRAPTVETETATDQVPDGRHHSEYVSVIESPPHRKERGIASQMSLDRSDFNPLAASLRDDPLRTAQSLPGVIAVDDFRSDFTVRGSPFHHANVVVDGVSAQWLQHTAVGRGPTGSLTMLSGLLVEGATLRSGAYPRRYADRLGPELELTLREGSRGEFGLRGAIGVTHAVLAAEGPLGGAGTTGSARGSWLLSARQSFLEWPPQSSSTGRTQFGFSDGMAKVVFDVRRTQQLGLTVLTGTSSVDDEDNLAPTELADGINRASLVSLSWQSTLGPAFVIKQQASLVTQRFQNTEQSGRPRDRGANREAAYRLSLSRPLAGGLLEAGAQVGRTAVTETSQSPELIDNSQSAWLRSGFAHFVWAPAPSFTLSPGLRVTSSTLTRTPAVSRWLLGEWSFRPRWSVIGSTGVSQQLPELSHAIDAATTAGLRPERAMHVELGIEQQLTSSVRWQATAFHRGESDVLRPFEHHRDLVDGLRAYRPSEPYMNALQGTARGIELLVDRRSVRGLSGWAGYAYGRTQQTNARGETYWADFDQRHTVNLFGLYRFAAGASVSTTWRAGSNFPLPHYLGYSDDRLVAVKPPNQVRLPWYSRLDLRADRQLEYHRRRFTIFVEALNVLNRTNVGRADGSIDPLTGEAIGYTAPLLRRRISAGVAFEF
jgi:hypothetical protein